MLRRVQRNDSKYNSESYTFLFYKKKTFQIISFSIHIYFFLFENTINTLFMLSWAWFFWSDWFCNSGFWIGASEISFGMKWFVTLYMSHVTFSQNIMVIGLLDSKLSEEFDIFTKKWIAWAHPENEITLFDFVCRWSPFKTNFWFLNDISFTKGKNLKFIFRKCIIVYYLHWRI